MSVTTEGDADSKLTAAALSARQLRQALAFLEDAPEDVAAWAGEQADALRAELAARAGAGLEEIPASAEMTGGAGSTAEDSSPPVADPLSHAVDPLRQPRGGGDLDDESDDFYAGLENDDDVLHRKRRATGAPKAGVAPAGGGGRVFTVRFALVVALLAGILGGIWYAALPTGATTPSTTTPTLGTGNTAPTEAEVLARIAELEAKVTADGADVDARLELGVLYFNQRRADEARAQWLAVTELAPDNATAWYNLGFYYLTIEPADMAAAKAAWQRVIDIDPASEMAKTASMHLAGLEDPTAGSTIPSPSPTGER